MSVLTNNKIHTHKIGPTAMASDGPAGAGGGPGIDPLIFETIWTTNGNGYSSDFQIQLPTLLLGTYDFHVDWGDGNSDDITTWNDAATRHTYSEIGTYTVQITGTFVGFAFNQFAADNGDDPAKLDFVTQWGILELGSTETGHFKGCNFLEVTATDAPVVGTTLKETFMSCVFEFTGASLSEWDVSTVTDMEGMFRSCPLFNADLSSWDVSGVTNMDSMFRSAQVFTGDITGWNTAAVTDMGSMFLSAVLFNVDIGLWVTTLVTDMNAMFSGATIFNQDIGGWNVANVTDMSDMFINAKAFNQDIGLWNTIKVTDMANMFRLPAGQGNFNQDIGGWDVDAVVSMASMFEGADSFDQDISGWDMVNKEFMADMFKNAGISTTNYNALLIGWESTADGSPGVNFNGGSSTYNAGAPATARTALQAKSWTITDGGQV